MTFQGKIPPPYFYIFDILILTVTFFISYYALPLLKNLFISSSFPNQFMAEATFLLAPLFNQEISLLKSLWFFISITLISIIFMEMLGGYRPLLEQSYSRIVVNSLLAPIAGLSLITLTLVALKSTEFSRLFILSYSTLSALALAIYRIILRIYFSKRQLAGHYAKNIALIGSPTGLNYLLAHFKDKAYSNDYRLLGYLSIPSSPTLSSLSDDQVSTEQAPRHFIPCGIGLPVAGGRAQQFLTIDKILLTNDPDKEINCVLTHLGEATSLGDLLINYPIHEVVVIFPMSKGNWLRQVIRDCEYFGVTLRIIPEALLAENWQDMQTVFRLDALHLPTIVMKPPFIESEALFFKRLFDIIVSTSLLIVLSPIFLVVGLAIKITTPNLPVFYPWRVVGKNGVDFTGYKFTTMVANADKLKPQLEGKNEMKGPVFKIENDPRITPLGRFLRKYSLNELPQLWSVLKGDMSLVGPRPAFRHELERYEFWQKRKLSIRPGITCLWQISGRNKISNFNEWVKLDLQYIDNWSLWLDFKILLRTFWVVIRGTGS